MEPTKAIHVYLTMLEQEHLLLNKSQIFSYPSFLEHAVNHISYDSRTVLPDTLFICKGAHFDRKYLLQAAEQGAFCYVSEQIYPAVTIPCILVSDIRLSMIRLASLFYDNLSDKLTMIGITGTKGKSTTAYYIKSILDHYMMELHQPETGLLSSIDTFEGVERVESHMTTPEPLDLLEHLEHAVGQGIRYFTMEVSSQALKYERVKGIQYQVGCFLNIGQDHISPIEHCDWEDYITSKMKLFRQCRVAVVNLDMDHAARVLEAAEAAEQVVCFSQKDAREDVYGYQVQKAEKGIAFRVRTAAFDDWFRISMPGFFNVENALAAIAVCVTLGVSQSAIYDGLLAAKVPGRMETYATKDGRVIAIVDYAHNELSFRKLLQSVTEEYPEYRIHMVFGCPGGKAPERRRDLGLIAAAYSQHIYLTEEDPGEESVPAICREIAGYIQNRCPYTILEDRGDAISAAILEARKKTVVLITGKGAETREKRGLDYITVPSDVDHVHRIIAQYNSNF